MKTATIKRFIYSKNNVSKTFSFLGLQYYTYCYYSYSKKIAFVFNFCIANFFVHGKDICLTSKTFSDYG